MGRLKIAINRAEHSDGDWAAHTRFIKRLYVYILPQSAGSCANTFRGQGTQGMLRRNGDRGWTLARVN